MTTEQKKRTQMVVTFLSARASFHCEIEFSNGYVRKVKRFETQHAGGGQAWNRAACSQAKGGNERLGSNCENAEDSGRWPDHRRGGR
jgi:hypothetical protein